MKKLGFTLAEVLIALAIIGVVAAMTLPNLVNEHQKDVWANSLSVNVSDIERTFSYLQMQEGVDNMFETSMWTKRSDYGGRVDEILKDVYKLETKGNSLIQYYNPNKYPIKSVNPTVPLPQNNAIRLSIDGWVYENKKGASILLKFYRKTDQAAKAGYTDAPLTKNEVIALGGQLTSMAAEMIIDVNGRDKKPNTIGRDIFYFVIGDDGKLFPYGGKDVMIYKNRAKPHKTHCPDNLRTVYDSLDGFSCTGRLVENGYKMDY